MAHIFGETPLFFIGTVLVIAVTFRVGVGAMKPASTEPEARAAAPVVHTPLARPTPAVASEPTLTAPAMPEPPTPLPKRKVPRVHGKR